MSDPFDAARVAYEAGQRDAIAAAVRRVTALQVSLIDARFNPNDPADYRQAVIFRQCIDAIKGYQP